MTADECGIYDMNHNWQCHGTVGLPKSENMFRSVDSVNIGD